ncbi:MAG: lantibiotic dehydratase, partial [Bacteroidota bacterium]
MFDPFPILLLRIGGLTSATLEQLSWDLQWPEKIQRLEANIVVARQQFLLSLQRELDQQKTNSDKSFLQFFYRSVEARQWPSSGKVKRLASFGDPIDGDFQQLIATRQRLAEAQEQFQVDYDHCLNRQFQQLFDLANDETLLKGMAMSSHSFLQRLLDLKRQSPAPFRKKAKQNLRSLWTYLSRITLKVSPFSTFTQLAIHPPNQLPDSSSAEKLPMPHNVQLNHLLYAYLQELLVHYPPFYQHLSLSLNSSLEEEEDYRFLLNSRNVESLQVVQKDPVVQVIIGLFKQGKPSLSFLTLLERVSAYIDAPIDVLAAYLDQLVKVGLLEWQWPVSGMHPFWLEQLLDFLPQTEEDELLTDLSNLLKRLRWGKTLLGQVPAIQKVNIQKECHQQLKTFWEHYQVHLPESAEVWQEGEPFQRLSSRAFIFKPENLFFEDCRSEVAIPLKDAFLYEQCQLLDDLLESLSMLQEDQLTYDLLHLHQSQFGSEAKPTILQFYRAYQSFEQDIDYTAYREKEE